MKMPLEIAKKGENNGQKNGKRDKNKTGKGYKRTI